MTNNLISRFKEKGEIKIEFSTDLSTPGGYCFRYVLPLSFESVFVLSGPPEKNKKTTVEGAPLEYIKPHHYVNVKLASMLKLAFHHK